MGNDQVIDGEITIQKEIQLDLGSQNIPILWILQLPTLCYSWCIRGSAQQYLWNVRPSDIGQVLSLLKLYHLLEINKLR